ncbi:MAG: DNA repair protein RecO [Clostridia bacterium]|nr:DNA repair protein RecO [Clostridia bacterium]MBQ9481066.1 DNA repair protein RecO [Clostridia bacterium]
MEEKLKAVVLRAVDYKDNDKILTLFSLENGVVSAAIRGVKKANAKLKFAAQPFCFCEYVLSKKGDRRSVVSADIIESFYPIREDIVRFYAGAVALEYVNAFVQEEMESEEAFLLLLSFLRALCYSSASPRALLVKFLIEALSLSGYELSVHYCIKCRKSVINRAFFDFDAGGAVCEDCREGADVEINPATLSLLSAADGASFDDITSFDFPLMIERKAIKLLSYYALVKAGVTLKSVNDLLLLEK